MRAGVALARDSAMRRRFSPSTGTSSSSPNRRRSCSASCSAVSLRSAALPSTHPHRDNSGTATGHSGPGPRGHQVHGPEPPSCLSGLLPWCPEEWPLTIDVFDGHGHAVCVEMLEIAYDHSSVALVARISGTVSDEELKQLGEAFITLDKASLE